MYVIVAAYFVALAAAAAAFACCRHTHAFGQNYLCYFRVKFMTHFSAGFRFLLVWMCMYIYTSLCVHMYIFPNFCLLVVVSGNSNCVLVANVLLLRAFFRFGPQVYEFNFGGNLVVTARKLILM